MIMTLTKEEKNTLKACKDAYIIAKAYQETIEQIDTESKQSVLNDVVFNYDKRWEIKEGKENKKRITDPRHDYLMSDKDSLDYYDFCHVERTKRGLKIPDAHTSSDFESWKLLRLAKDNLIDYALSILPEPLKTDMVNVKKSYKYEQKFLELICKLNIETIKERKLAK